MQSVHHEGSLMASLSLVFMPSYKFPFAILRLNRL